MQHPGNAGQIAYWDTVAGARDCTLEPPLDVLLEYLPKDAKILDFGCGYGRSLVALAGLGFSDLTGFDPSPAMIARGKREHPEFDLRLFDAPALPVADGSFDAALLVGVLTAVAEDEEQRRLMTELRRALRPGGLALVCDFPLQGDARNRERYERYAAKYGRYGVFEVEGGGVARHHDPAWLDALTSGFERLHTLTLDAVTLTGKPAKAISLVVRKPD